MTDHEELCGECHPHDHYCHCALIARVRADEREQVGRVWAKREDLLLGDIEVARADERAALNGKLLRLYTQITHAEAVAAKLVEVIRVDDLRLRTQKGHTAQARRERDAARADAIRHSDEIDRMVRELSAIRMEHEAEVAALSAERLEALQKVAALDDHLATLKRLDDADTAEIDRLKEAVALRAEVAVLRESIARDIEAAWQDQCDDWRVPERCESCRAYDLAVRIARGEP